LSGHYGAIDLFWKRILLVEHKSAGQDLSRAQSQAFDYIQALVNEGRLDEIPRYVIVSDFARIALYDLEPEDQKDLPLFAGRRFEPQFAPQEQLSYLPTRCRMGTCVGFQVCHCTETK
ncbi:MAG: hypothetical protein HYR76_06420, partial [Ignavibacteria bacterium]|nr:hypothetical protein [Ignavibacteria bacterium]